jgi:heme exporter protein CcmD
MQLGPYAGFIVLAYAIAGAVVLALVSWVVVDHRRQLRALSGLESQGVSRRSQALHRQS